MRAGDIGAKLKELKAAGQTPCDAYRIAEMFGKVRPDGTPDEEGARHFLDSLAFVGEIKREVVEHVSYDAL